MKQVGSGRKYKAARAEFSNMPFRINLYGESIYFQMWVWQLIVDVMADL